VHGKLRKGDNRSLQFTSSQNIMRVARTWNEMLFSKNSDVIKIVNGLLDLLVVYVLNKLSAS
jgi:hypothetical protein